MRYENQCEHPHMLYVTRSLLDDENREYGRTTTMRSSGCGLCAGIMAVDRLLPFYEFSLEDAIQLSYDAKANLRIGTEYTKFGPALAEKFNLRYQMSDKLEDLLHCVRTGGAAVALVGCPEEGRLGLFTKSLHYITVINEEPDGRLAILDPSFTPTKYETEDRKDKVEIKHGVVILCGPDVLHAETVGQTGPYYLFWRV